MQSQIDDFDVVIGCVDSRVARITNRPARPSWRSRIAAYWLDLGNAATAVNSHGAEEEPVIIGSVHPIQDALVWLHAHQFGDGVRVEQEAVHSSILRPVSWLRSNFISIPTKGDSRKN